MLSKDCTIDEFVQMVRGREPWSVIELAVEEADQVDRVLYRAHGESEDWLHQCRQYSRNLKQLIGYMRYTVKPRPPKDKTYILYSAYWGETSREHTGITMTPPGEVTH